MITLYCISITCVLHRVRQVPEKNIVWRILHVNLASLMLFVEISPKQN